MKRTCALVAVWLALAVPSAVAQTPYHNPVLQSRFGVADPFLLKWNGEYYLYATGDPIMAYHSTDLVHWDTIGAVIASSRAADAWNQADVWAPEVAYRNGKFYLYYSASKASPDWRVGEMARRVGVGVSDSPRGPFIDSGAPVTPGWGIDGHVFKDPDDGREYLFYSYLYEPRLPGAGIVADAMTSWKSVAGKPSHVTRGSEAWEDKDGDPGNGSLRYTNEAPTVIKRNGRYYMMYSGGSWDLPTYSMGYAVSDAVLHDGLDGAGWTKIVPPMLRSTPLVEGPGHNSVAKAPNNVDDISAYHARTVPFVGPGDRQTFIDRLYLHHDRLYMDQPSTGALAAPAFPLFRDIFDRAGGALGATWRIVNGNWRVVDSHASGSGLALIPGAALHHYVFEANVRLPNTPGAAAGVAAYYHDRNNHVDVVLDAAARALRSSGALNGHAIETQTTPLPADFRFDAYHQLLITKNANSLGVDVDGVHALQRNLALADGSAGMLTKQGSADFDGVALTGHYSDGFDAPGLTWETQGGSWLAEDGALRQVAAGSDRAFALKGDVAENYEFSASVRLRDTESEKSTVGIIAAAADQNLVVAGFDHTIWPFARFWVQQIIKGNAQRAIAVEMPRGFDYNAHHTIRIVRQQTAFTFFLDGAEMVAARFTIGAARPGFYTEGARAAFDDASMTVLSSPRNFVLDGSFDSERWDANPLAGDNQWTLASGAQVSMCCAHTGIHRLLLDAPAANALQNVTQLTPGKYRLLFWTTTQDADAVVKVSAGARVLASTTATGGAWQESAIDFELPAGVDVVTIMISPTLHKANGFAAVDDVYLYKR